MPGQPQLFSNQESPKLHPSHNGDAVRPSPAVEIEPAGLAPVHPTRRIPLSGRPTPVWLQRLSLFVLVLFCVYLGVLVLILPWWPRIWDHNMFIQAHPRLAAVLHNGAVRGIISGLGLLDIWIGISEAVHYRDYRD
jgi:hypothetical protein